MHSEATELVEKTCAGERSGHGIAAGRAHVAPCQFMMKNAAKQGLRDGCRGNAVCMRAVGLIFGTSSGNTEAIAGMIEDEAGLEAINIDDVDIESLKDSGSPTRFPRTVLLFRQLFCCLFPARCDC